MTHVFLTGSSGTIGSALVPRLLADPAQQVTLLLRAGRHGDLSARLSGLRADWGLADGDPRLQRLHTVQGDIAQPQLGLSDAQLAELAQRCTHIIHCAASVKLNMALDEARATAVTPTRSILALARRCAAPARDRSRRHRDRRVPDADGERPRHVCWCSQCNESFRWSKATNCNCSSTD